MTVTKEISIKTFEFWCGAVDNRNLLTDEECDQLEEMLDELNHVSESPMSETTLNDFMWFDFSTICEWLGLNEEEVYARK